MEENNLVANEESVGVLSTKDTSLHTNMIFSTNNGITEVMKITKEGEFYVNGNKVETDVEIYRGMVEFLTKSGCYVKPTGSKEPLFDELEETLDAIEKKYNVDGLLEMMTDRYWLLDGSELQWSDKNDVKFKEEMEKYGDYGGAYGYDGMKLLENDSEDFTFIYNYCDDVTYVCDNKLKVEKGE